MPKKKTLLSDEQILSHVIRCKNEAENARRLRILQNRLNFDCFHLRQDYSHKKSGQSREFLGKVANSVEIISSFMQQGLIDIGKWFRIVSKPGVSKSQVKIPPSVVYDICLNEFEKLDLHNKIGDLIKLGLIGSLMIAKVHGKKIPKPRYITNKIIKDGIPAMSLGIEHRLAWELQIEYVRQEDYYPDPTGRGMYEIQTSEMDWHTMMDLANEEDSLYDKDAIDGLGALMEDEKRFFKARETNQLMAITTISRKPIQVWEYWGDILDPSSGEVVYRNALVVVGNKNKIILGPIDNPCWHQSSPFVVAPILPVPNSVWHRAVMDAPVMHNRALNELYNLMVDGGMYSVHGIKQIRSDWLENPKQVSNGVAPGDTLEANMQCPPGMKVLERVDTSSVPPEAINVFNLMMAEYNQSSYTNELRSGMFPQRAVKATEVVEASQTLTGVFAGLAKNIEQGFIRRLLDKSWMTIAQHVHEMDSAELMSVLGEKAFMALSMLTDEEIFAETVNGYKFDVFGITRTMNKLKDFRKFQGLLQTIGSSPVMMESFARKYDFSKLLDVIMDSMDVDTKKIELDEGQQGLGQIPPMAGANVQSQIPQAGAQVNNKPSEENPAKNRGNSGGPGGGIQGGMGQ
jgi:hypothetical protein